MPVKGHKKQSMADDYSEGSDNGSYKKVKVENTGKGKEAEEPVNPLNYDIDYELALSELKKQRDAQLLLIRTEHQMRLDTAKKLADFEQQRLQELYNNEMVELKKKVDEEKNTISKRVTDSRKHRLLPHGEGDTAASQNNKKDTTLTTALAESTIIEDIQYMVNEWYALAKRCGLEYENTIIPLPGNCLVANNLYLTPGMPCMLLKEGEWLPGVYYTCDMKEFTFKPDREKRHRYTIDSLRNGELALKEAIKQEDVEGSVKIEENYRVF